MSNETEQKLKELQKQKQACDKLLLKCEWVIGVLSCIVLLAPIVLGSLLPMEEWKRVVLVFSGFIPAMAGICFSVKIEQVAGYYECAECGHKYVPTFKATTFAMHMGRTRYMRCPKCGQRSWQKKVLRKD